VIDARDGDVAGFQRLAQRVEHLAGEFRIYVAVTPSAKKTRPPTEEAFRTPLN
jgi:hypothetical protein